MRGGAAGAGGRVAGGPLRHQPLSLGHHASPPPPVDLFSAYPSPRLASFDSRGGALELTGLTIEVDHAAVADLWLHNASPFPVTASDYTWDLYFNTIVQIGAVKSEGGHTDDPPFFGPGAFWWQPAEDLAAADSDPVGGEDFWRDQVRSEIEATFEHDPVEDAAVFDALTDRGEVTMVVGGFTENFFNWSEGAPEEGLMYADVDAIRYSGTITVTYHYDLAD